MAEFDLPIWAHEYLMWFDTYLRTGNPTFRVLMASVIEDELPVDERRRAPRVTEMNRREWPPGAKQQAAAQVRKKMTTRRAPGDPNP